MAGIMDFFSREAGQRRRQELEDGISYYIPPELRGLLGLANELNPVTSIERAGQSAERIVDPNVQGWDKVQAVGDTASNMAGVLAPVGAAKVAGMPAVQAIEEALLGLSSSPAARGVLDEVGRQVVDETGALRLFPGDYIGGHSAPELDVGASLDNPTVMFGGDDIYGSKAMQYFGTGMDSADAESLGAISRVRGKPERMVAVYRAVPKDAPNEIGAGDWVTTSRAYAKDHGEASLGGKGNYRIVKEAVQAKELATDGNSINEWGWWPADWRIKNALSEGRMSKATRASLENYARSRGLLGD